MPVRSLTLSVFKWPDRATVDKAVREWAIEEAKHRPELLFLGYFGSYARGEWGVGSDLDLIAVLSDSVEAFERRCLSWNLNSLPVPAEILIYTEKEWEGIQKEGGLFARTLIRDAVWLFETRESEKTPRTE